MTTTQGQNAHNLADYRPYPFVLSATRMRFALAPTDTRVRTELSLAPRDPGQAADLVLDGGKGVRLLALTIDGAAPVGTPVLMADGREAGTLFTQSGGRAIAHLRFDRMDGPLTAGGAAILAADEQAQATP